MKRKPQKPNSKTSLAEKALRLGDSLDLPAQLLPGFCHVELWQNRQAVVDGVKGVLSYSGSSVQLSLGALVVTFRGADLTIKSYQLEQLQLTGVIAEIHYTT
ncbi:MAG: YabP/YqfC family sporulation protein [Oscillospiraceae bacterium]|nr:YabP/YqfC family sporulation protein [Oscillospiraceae bacterium]